MKHTSMKKVDDIRSFKGKRWLNPDKKSDRKSMDYKSIRYKDPENSTDPEYNWHEYDNIFKFLYNMPMLYTRVLKEIDNVHEEYGYLTPIVPSAIANKLNFPVAIILDIMHTFRRKRIIFLYKHNIVRLHKLLNKRNILEMMFRRHPSVAKHKGLNYKKLTSTKK